MHQHLFILSLQHLFPALHLRHGLSSRDFNTLLHDSTFLPNREELLTKLQQNFLNGQTVSQLINKLEFSFTFIIDFFFCSPDYYSFKLTIAFQLLTNLLHEFGDVVFCFDDGFSEKWKLGEVDLVQLELWGQVELNLL